MSVKYRVEMNNISKSFGGVKALDNVDLHVKSGEILALVGENGAGKSTLMKILSGAYRKDKGSVMLDGEEVQINSPHIGRELGISIIYQEFALVPDLTVAENIFLGDIYQKNGIIKWNTLYEEAGKLIESLGFEINPRTKLKNLSIAYQQVVEICKALSEEAKVLILDEPTAVLAPNEVKLLFRTLKTLKERGVSIIYISHRLEEIFEIADRAEVLKDGKLSGVVNVEETNRNEVINLMIGRELKDMFPKRDTEIGKDLLTVNNLSNDVVEDISFSVKEGEVFGIAGLVGSGRTEIARSIFGADKMDNGEIILNDKNINTKSPKQALQNGIGMVPEDRKEQGVILTMDVKTNITMPMIKNISRIGVINRNQEKEHSQNLVDLLNIKTTNIHTDVKNLSGGNQQKVSLAKWFGINCDIVILDEPTRGVDVGAKVEIYKLINELARQKIGVIMISSEMTEIIAMCDRAAVMYRGNMTGILNKNELTEENIMRLAIGEDGNNG